uniref:Probable tRNA pseudouridine synthase D n=1 Tax=Thermofilum pendens TaxID=2269 RepID=A0A7C1T1Z9_THEPE
MPRRSYVELDLKLGMEYYGLDLEGCGGVIRRNLEDFIVYEISIDGFVASPNCPEERGAGEYVWLVLEKRKLDTVTALKLVERHFGLHRSSLGVAGLKDTAAITYQHISLKHEVSEEQLEEFNAKHKRVKLYCPIRRPFHLRPGMLLGNRFIVVVREVRNPELAVEAVKLVQELGGVPNYYGYQRFGSIRPVTHVVGKLILQGDFKRAAEEMLLRVFEGESPRAKQARALLAETGDYSRVLEVFPKSMHNERVLIAYLARHPGDYVGAFRKLPPYVRKLLVGAYQAYLFNKLLSRRIEAGLPYAEAVPGDIVGIYSERKAHEPVGVLVVNSAIVDKVNRWIKQGKAALLLPIFGYNTPLLPGKPGELELEVLREEGLDLEAFKLKSIPEASSAGTYRPAALKPLEISIKVEDSIVLLSFTLRKGMYATTLLREIVKPEDPPSQGF